MLKFDGKWRFDSPGEISDDVVSDVFDLIGKIAPREERQRILEHFKYHFADAAGYATGWSSNVSWAQTDLYESMRRAAENAPLFIEAFFDACESLKKKNSDIAIPNVSRINRLLAQNKAGYEIDPPHLISHNPEKSVVVLERVASLDEEAQEIIQQSLKQSDQLLSEGRYRQAVQEVLWLLETVTTAFEGIEMGSGTVQGKYFNKIARDLRKHNKGKTIEQVLNWVTTLHGFLSSPTGGGVRHGTDLKRGISIGRNEARLFCNLIRSYISFLIQEHERLTVRQSAGKEPE